MKLGEAMQVVEYVEHLAGAMTERQRAMMLNALLWDENRAGHVYNRLEMSRRTASRVWSKYPVTFRDVVQLAELLPTLRALAQTQYTTVKEIAKQYGHADQFTMSNAMWVYFGVRPSAIRRMTLTDRDFIDRWWKRAQRRKAAA